jgi:hypothetical protein
MDLKEFQKMTKEEQMHYDFKKTIKDECIDVENKNSIYEDRVKEAREKIYNEKNSITRLKEWKFERYIALTEKEYKNLKLCYKIDEKPVKGIGHDCDTTKLSLEIINQYLCNGNGFIRYFDRSKNQDGRLDFRRELVICKDNNSKLLIGNNKKDCVYYMGDTINSIQTIANEALKIIIKNDYNNGCFGKETFITLEKLSMLDNKELKIVLIDDVKAEEIFKNLKKLVDLTHTMGNFIAVPTKVFNRDRYKLTKDFFDLTLEGIRQYYLKEVHTPMCRLWCKYRNIQWLNQYIIPGDEKGENSWQNFVNNNLLQDYIKEENGKYIVDILFKGHSFNKILPKTIDELNDCLDKMCKKIELRSERIYKKLNN